MTNKNTDNEYSEEQENHSFNQLEEQPVIKEDVSEEVFDGQFDDKHETFSVRATYDYGEELPQVVEDYVEAAVKVSNGNYIPASISFFTILGQIVKDFIHIPYGQGREDTRIHFCWIQTSGTGKSTLWNFVGPVADRTFKKINNNPLNRAHPALVTNSPEPTVPDSMPRKFDIFGLTDYTDAVLIGNFSKDKAAPTLEIPSPEWKEQRNPGKLEGNGLAHWDEFEYSGIFNQSQHQEKSIVYLNTLMNSLVGESWIISKALVSYENKEMECYCERSIFALTYPPENLNEVIATKGVMQRMLVYVKKVSKEAQRKIRLEQINLAGTIQEVDAPIDKYAEAMFKLYTLTQERFKQVGGDPLKVVTYGPNFNKALLLAYGNLEHDTLGYRFEVDELADNFTTRMTKTLIRMAVLCCVAQSPAIKDKSQRFIVTGHNVRQAERIIRQCYKSLVEWLDQSLHTKKDDRSLAAASKRFRDVYTAIKQDDDGFIRKKVFLAEVIKASKKSKAQVYRDYNAVQKKNKMFIEEKYGRAVYVKLPPTITKNNKGEKK